MRANLEVKIGKINLKNPVTVASGTFGYAKEFAGIASLKSLGAIITKTITLNPRQGNQPPRIVETAAGMLNSIGLQNEGIKNFIKEKLPYLKKIKTNIIVSIQGNSEEEFALLAKKLSVADVSGLELNVSCPNVAHKSKTALISQDPDATYKVVKEVKRSTKLTIITKLSPNVTDISQIAKAAEDAGSDAVSLVNTFMGMAIDIDSRAPKLGNRIGGLSGPAIKPIALKLVNDVYNKVKIPIIGMGGIADYKDALEFIIAGATAVSVGTMNFVNPKGSIEIAEGIRKYLDKNSIFDINEIIGSLT